MFKLTLFLSLFVLGTSGRFLARNADEWTEEHLRTALDITFCVCDDVDRDGSLALDEFTGGVCEAALSYIFDYQVNEEDFNAMDADQDGLVTQDEAFNALMSLAAGRTTGRQNLFSNDDFVEAGVRVFGCSCDTDGSWTVDWQEATNDVCVAVQELVAGEALDETHFEMADSNNDGELDGQEVAAAIEWLMENAMGK